MTPTAVLTIGEDTYELPIVEGADGQRAIDVRTLHARSGMIVLDEGLGSTAICRSAITTLDGARGELRYRGQRIEELADHADFLTVAHLLIFGELPTESTRATFADAVAAEASLPQEMQAWFGALPTDADPMAILCGAVAVVGTYYGQSVDLYDGDAVRTAVHRILGKLPTMAAVILRHADGAAWPQPGAERSYVGRLLSLLFEADADLPVPRDVALRALDVALLLQADHEQNTSTTAARVVGSTYASPYAIVAAAIGALSGPRHGGAGQAVASMLRQIVTETSGVRDFVERVKRKEEGALLMGFGHRVYATHDPRASILKRQADLLLTHRHDGDSLLDAARELETVARKDDYFIEHQLQPNFDFYACVVYHALGLPARIYPVLFALGRAAGWLAQWREMMLGKPRIVRPRQVYIGEMPRTP